MSKNMSIILSPSNESNEQNLIHKGQTIGFINVLRGANPMSEKPSPLQYNNKSAINESIVLLNYTKDIDVYNISYSTDEGYTPLRFSTEQTIDLFRREVTTVVDDDGDEIIERNLTPLVKVGENVENYDFYDFNISNDRTYQYILYPTVENGVAKKEAIIHTHWYAWSITELHPINGSNKNFYADENDVWLFNLNVETGEQTQNLAKTEIQTLGTYSKYSQGRRNAISGSVSCLIGSDVLPVNYITKKTPNGKGRQSAEIEGGYVESRPFNMKPTSNERIDMLKAWRGLVFSKNPKLLKDKKGQSFLVTLIQSNNTPRDDIRKQPDTISFSWMQIGSTDDITVLSSKSNQR